CGNVLQPVHQLFLFLLRQLQDAQIGVGVRKQRVAIADTGARWTFLANRERNVHGPGAWGQGGVGGGQAATAASVMPPCRSSASICGARPRNATNDSIAGRLPPTDRI